MLLTVSLFLTGIVAMAADISFVVYYAKGTVTKNSKIKIKKGDIISSTDALMISDQSSVILICSNHKAIQLDKKGSYTAKSLLAKCTATGASYSSSYFRYVWDEFTHPHGKPEANPQAYMKNVGAVSRGCNSVATGIGTDSLVIGKGVLNIHWKSDFGKSVMAVFDVPMDGAALQKTILEKGAAINMEQATKGLEPGNYYWQVTDAEGNGCERNFLTILDTASYQLRVDELLSQVLYTTAAETAYMRGYVLEENHLIAAAIASYTMAAHLEPGNKLYSKTLSKFYASEF